MSERSVLTAEERALPYAHFYDLPMTPIPDEKLAILAAGPMDCANALPIERRNDIFLPGYLPGEVGYCIMPDGSAHVANCTKMPGVTAEMFEWWFAWHCLNDLRYRIWDPEDHFFARTRNPEKVLDSSVPLREKTWGTVHHVLEDVGPGPEELLLNFRYPHELGYEEEKVGTELCATMMCANGHGVNPGEGVAAIMTHMIREIEGGVELRSRFWIGYGYADGKIVKLIPDGVQVPEIAARSLFAHNLKEFSHLATVLPLVYAQEKNNW